jgi:ribosomal protein L2
MSTNGHFYRSAGHSELILSIETAQFRAIMEMDSGTERAYYYL